MQSFMVVGRILLGRWSAFFGGRAQVIRAEKKMFVPWLLGEP
jgi:hypothetical protein